MEAEVTPRPSSSIDPSEPPKPGEQLQSGGSRQSGPTGSSSLPPMGGYSLMGSLAHSLIITADDTSHQVKIAPHFQHKTPQLLPGVGVHFTPVHYVPGECPCSSLCHFPLSWHTLPPPPPSSLSLPRPPLACRARASSQHKSRRSAQGQQQTASVNSQTNACFTSCHCLPQQKK